MYMSSCGYYSVYRSVCISLEAAEDTDVTLALSYVVSSASWSPQYDLRVFSSDKTMKVTINNFLRITGEHVRLNQEASL